MELKRFGQHFYQSTLGVAVELAYSFALIVSCLAISYLVLAPVWFLNRL